MFFSNVSNQGKWTTQEGLLLTLVSAGSNLRSPVSYPLWNNVVNQQIEQVSNRGDRPHLKLLFQSLCTPASLLGLASS